MKVKNKNGFSLIEIIIAMMIVGLVTTLSTALLIFGLQSFNTTARQIDQHDIVKEITRRISKDIQAASKYHIETKVDSSDPNGSYTELYLQFPATPSGITPTPSALNWKCWKIQDGGLYVQVGSENEYKKDKYNINNYTKLITGLDTSQYTDRSGNPVIQSNFTRNATLGDTIILNLKPVSTNTTIHKNRNILKPITSEYSVKYKGDLDTK